MPINASKARSLCTANEYNLFKWSSVKMSKTLSPSQLKQKIDRARKLRNKYRDLAKQQRGEARGKRKPTGTRAAKGNDRTVEKAELFAEVLERFESALKTADAKSKKSTAKKTTRKKSSRKQPTEKSAAKKKKKKTTASKAPKKKAVKNRGAKKTGMSAKKKSARRSGAKPSIPLAAGATPVTNPSLSDGGGHESPFSHLVEGQGKSDIDARRTRRRKTSKDAKSGRIESQFARTAQEKIHGHVSGQTKRNQARRDTKS